MADSQYNAFVTATAVPATTATMTVNAGTMTVTKTSDSTSGNVTNLSNGVSLAKYELKAYGEPIKVQYLTAGFASDNVAVTKLRNGSIYANGVQIGSTADLKDDTLGGTTFSLGSSLVVTPGTPVEVEIKADMYDNDGTNNLVATDTLTADLIKYTNAGQLQTSLGYIDVPSAQQVGNQVTVQTGTISLSKLGTYGDQNIVIPNNAVKLGSFTLVGNNIEDVTVNSFTVNFTPGDQFAVNTLSDVYLKYGSKTTTVKSTVSASALTNTWSVSEPLAKNGSMVIEVWGSVGTFTVAGGNDTMRTSLLVSGTTVSSGQTVTTNTGNVLAGQLLTATAGAIHAAVDGSTPTAGLVTDNGSADLAAFRINATNDNYTITDVITTVGANAATNISSLDLVNVATGLVVASAPVNGTTAEFAGLSIPVTANGYATLKVVAHLGTVGFGQGVTGADLKVRLVSFKANNSQGVEDASQASLTLDGQDIYVYAAVPTVALQTLPTTLLSAGTQTVGKFSVTSSNGPISWKSLVMNISKTSAPTIATSTGANGSQTVTLYDENNVAIPGTITLANVTGTMGSAGAAAAGTITFVATNEQLINGTKTYTVKAVIGGTITTGESISTAIAQASGLTNVAPTNYGAAAGNFVWSDQAPANTPTHDAVSTSADWNNEWLVKNIPTDSQTLSR